MALAAEIIIGRAITTFVTCGTVIDLTGRVSSRIGWLLDEDYDKVKKCLKKLDLKAKINSVKSVIQQCKSEGYYDYDYDRANKSTEAESFVFDANLSNSVIENYHPEKNKELPLTPIDLHVFYLYDVIDDICKELEKITHKIAEHKLKYLNSYRRLDVERSLTSLETFDNILKQRYERFLNLLNIPFMQNKSHKDLELQVINQTSP